MVDLHPTCHSSDPDDLSGPLVGGQFASPITQDQLQPSGSLCV
ncbi:unnamed protein product, partial [Dibothriocephalus latus]